MSKPLTFRSRVYSFVGWVIFFLGALNFLISLFYAFK